MEPEKYEKDDLEKKIPDPGEIEILKDRPEPVGSFEVKPWGFDEMERLNTTLQKIYEAFKAQKITVSDFFHVSKTIEKNGVEKSSIEILNFDKLYFTLMPFMREVFKASIKNSLTEKNITDEDISKITAIEMPSLFMTIVQQNIGFLKNWFALVKMMAAKTLV
jgi:hypothetical protein